MTGWAPGRTFGTIGDFLLFAPRFLQSRLLTVSNGALGLRPGATLAQRQARNSLLKLVGYGTVLTFAINEMLGNETDVRPILNGRKNPNFIRIRAGGRDWSLAQIARGVIHGRPDLAQAGFDRVQGNGEKPHQISENQRRD